jgi:hypothetical protein
LNPGKSLTFPDVPFSDKKKVIVTAISANTGSMNYTSMPRREVGCYQWKNQPMEQLHILRCAFSASAKISFVSKLVCVAYSVLWENQLLLGNKIVFLPITLISPPFLPNSEYFIHFSIT